MKHFLLLSFTAIISSSLQAADEPPLQLDPVKYVDFKSSEGMKRLERAKYKTDFFYLANQFEPQEITYFGGPATAATVMNALRLQKENGKDTMPNDPRRLTKDELSYVAKDAKPFFNRFTQHNIFKEGVKDKFETIGKPVKTEKGEAKDLGFQLRQLQALFVANGFKADIHVVDDSVKLKDLKTAFKNGLKDPKDFIVVNYRRLEMGQPHKNGHLSPLAAYDEKSDSFLVMDVNPNISTWGWVKADALLKAMNTKDTIENRGYLVVSDQ
jgi:hypothetical protein